MERKFGRIDFESEALNFIHTDYYEKEFGKDLTRVFVSFKKLIPADRLPAIKIITNNFEARSSRNKLRRINIDPGYLELSKFVLATTKDYMHRIYLGDGIYAEITLFYRKGSFCPWEWTYPDYRTPATHDFCREVRRRLLNEAAAERPAGHCAEVSSTAPRHG